MGTGLLILGAAVGLLLLGKKKGTNDEVDGVSGVLWEYAIAEVEDAGFDLDKNYYNQVGIMNASELGRLRRKFGYRQSANARAMGRSENYSFWLALQHHKEKLGL